MIQKALESVRPKPRDTHDRQRSVMHAKLLKQSIDGICNSLEICTERIRHEIEPELQ